MKVVAFLGSPRAGGNTDTLAESILDGASQVGGETESIALRNLEIRPCIGCEKCWSKGRACVLKDDMPSLYEAIAGSDVLVFATPVYWYAPTAIMKAFIDRLVVFNRPEGRPLIEGKDAVVAVAYEEEGPTAAEPLLRMFELSFDYLGLRFIDRVVVDGVGPKGAILNKPDAVEGAVQVGRSLGRQSGAEKQ